MAGARDDEGRSTGSGEFDDHESLRILLLTYRELAVSVASCSNQLRALLLTGDTADRAIARGRLGDVVVADLLQRGGPSEAAGGLAEREVQIRRLAVVLLGRRGELAESRERLGALVHAVAPGLTARYRVGPVRAAEIVLGSARAPR